MYLGKVGALGVRFDGVRQSPRHSFSVRFGGAAYAIQNQEVIRLVPTPGIDRNAGHVGAFRSGIRADPHPSTGPASTHTVDCSRLVRPACTRETLIVEVLVQSGMYKAPAHHTSRSPLKLFGEHFDT